jgi:hypothetical protein
VWTECYKYSYFEPFSAWIKLRITIKTELLLNGAVIF